MEKCAGARESEAAARAHNICIVMKLFNLAFRIFRRDLHSVGIIGAPFSKGQVCDSDREKKKKTAGSFG